jgi:hypothetical protein
MLKMCLLVFFCCLLALPAAINAAQPGDDSPGARVEIGMDSDQVLDTADQELS